MITEMLLSHMSSDRNVKQLYGQHGKPLQNVLEQIQKRYTLLHVEQRATTGLLRWDLI